jgi:hypothetical protein
MASKWRGTKSARRLVRNIPEAMRGELVVTLDEGGSELLSAMKARAPFRTGNLRAGMEKRVYPKTLKLRVGLFAATRRRLSLFYAHILEYGRKAQTVTIKRGPRAGETMRVGAIKEKRFVSGFLPRERALFRRKLKAVWGRVLSKAAAGAGDE